MSELKSLLARQNIVPDPVQLEVIERLEVLNNDLMHYQKSLGSLRGFFKRPAVPQGIYLYGSFGSGKSTLMDAFYRTTPIKNKLRVHFHQFMRDTHTAITTMNEVEPLTIIADNLAQKYCLICFDEFHISDIADAMILHRLLTAVYKKNICFIFTSNYAPQDLYPDGLHRERLLPALELLAQRNSIIRLNYQDTDYRLKFIASQTRYFYPLSDDYHKKLKELFRSLSCGLEAIQPFTQDGRSLPPFKKACGSIVWFEFTDLCRGNFGANDYLALTQKFDTFFIVKVPQMQKEDANIARRFTWLIDVLYQSRALLFVNAEVKAQELYQKGLFAQEFSRTVSRLVEMQSEQYQTHFLNNK